MPRHEDTRSPVGSTSSKRSHRDDDRERSRRDDVRSHRRRSRTRSPDVRIYDGILPQFYADSLIQRRQRDRDPRYQRDRSRDRYRETDSYRSGRRDRSRDRRRSRDRDRLRDDYRHRDYSRDRDRKRRDPSPDTSRKPRRGDSRERPKPSTAHQSSTTTASQDEQTKKAERLAKLEAWKQKQAAERDRKQNEADAADSTRNLLAEIDKKAEDAPARTIVDDAVVTAETIIEDTPIPYAGKFDPKAIAKKAAAASAGSSSKLGTDLIIPESAIASASVNSHKLGPKADRPPTTTNGANGGCSACYDLLSY